MMMLVSILLLLIPIVAIGELSEEKVRRGFSFPQIYPQLSNVDNQEQLLDSLPQELLNVYESKTARFPYYDSHIASLLKSFEAEYRYVNVTKDELLFSCSSSSTSEDFCSTDPVHNTNETSRKYYYYSGNIMQDRFESFRSKFHVDNVLRSHRSLPALTAHVWMGQANVHATIHYDAVMNIFVQLYGKKKFLLYPPQSLARMAMYGRNHPFACQSRFSDPSTRTLLERSPYSLWRMSHINSNTRKHKDSSNTMDSIVKVNAIEVVLEAGDVLYIPPFWLHEAIALTPSMSVSFWWDPKSVDSLQDLDSLPLPIEEGWTETKTLHAIYEYFSAILQTLSTLEGDDFVTEAQQLLRNRFLEDYELLHVVDDSFRDERHIFDKDEKAKISRYAAKTASVLHTALLQDPSLNCLLQSEQGLDDIIAVTEPHTSSTVLSAEGECRKNLRSILALKTCDYFEEVSIFLASYLPPLTFEHMQDFSSYQMQVSRMVYYLLQYYLINDV